MISREDMEEYRQDMLETDYADVQEEITLRSDDDAFYEYLVDNFRGDLLKFKYCCNRYDRGDQIDDWFQIITEK